MRKAKESPESFSWHPSFPLSVVWAVGTLVGVRMIMSGWTLITVGGLAKDAATQ